LKGLNAHLLEHLQLLWSKLAVNSCSGCSRLCLHLLVLSKLLCLELLLQIELLLLSLLDGLRRTIVGQFLFGLRISIPGLFWDRKVRT
jgi:hypothetical protein